MEYFIGVFRTTFCMHVVKITKFLGIYIDFRKRDMIPSAFEGQIKNPQGKLEVFQKAAIGNQRK
jgi:hypothetical protein